MAVVESDKPVALFPLIGVMGARLFVQQAFDFSGSWRDFINKRGGEGVRAQLLLIGLVSLLFFPLLGFLSEQRKSFCQINSVRSWLD